MNLNVLIILVLGFLSSCGSQQDEDPAPAPITAPQSAPQVEEKPPLAYATPTNLNYIRSTIEGLEELHQSQFRGQGIRIAVLDNGFAGLEQARGKTLPPALEVEKAPGNGVQATEHGTRMAELAYLVASGQNSYVANVPAPEILLFNTNGFTNLKHAIDQVIAKRVDIVLYAQIWQFGGHFEGGGLINKEVNRAIEAGVLCVNAAGNFAESSYSDIVKTDANRWLLLPDQGQSLSFSIKEDDTPASIVLSWGDGLSEIADDLDLFLYDEKFLLIASSENTQQLPGTPQNEKTSRLAKEDIKLRFGKGRYYLKVRRRHAKTANVNTEDVKFRISIDGAFVQFQNSQPTNSVMIPADNERVVTVGATDFKQTSYRTLQGLPIKPEVWSTSHVTYSNGFALTSTSTASAIVTGALASYFSKVGRLSKDDLQQHLSRQLIKFSAPPDSFLSNEKPSPKGNFVPILRRNAKGTFHENNGSSPQNDPSLARWRSSPLLPKS